jgi:hypothetical protein
LLSAGAGIILLPLPFALPNVSLPGYLATLRVAQKHGISPHVVLLNLEWAAIYLIPVCVVLNLSLRPRAMTLSADRNDLLWYGAFLLIGVLGICIMAGKPGSGPHHLMPLMPCALDLFCRCSKEIRIIRRPLMLRPSPYVITILMFAVFQGDDTRRYLTRIYHATHLASDATSEIRRLERQYPNDTIELGSGENAGIPASSLIPLLVFDGQPYTIDKPAIDDFELGGVPIPAATFRYLNDCRTSLWLIPAGQTPFTTTSNYDEKRVLFGEDLRETFRRNYRKIETGPVFDVWSCRSRSGQTVR